MLRRKAAYAASILAAIIALAVIWARVINTPPAYRFEAVSEQIPVGKNVRIEVRLLGPHGDPVPFDAVALKNTRLDMGPDGMAMMDAPLTPAESGRPGVFAFETNIVMAGRWALTIEASVRGDPNPVKGVVIYTAAEKQAQAAPASRSGDRKVLYYRNPMGLADISKTPKKDSMGMAYIPVYENEIAGTAGSVRISLDKVQRAGVRTAKVERRILTRKVRGAGVVMADESRLAVVAAKFSGFVEHLDVRTTGEMVKAGAPLLTAWVESDDLIQKMVDLASSSGDERMTKIAKRNLRLYDVTESDIANIAKNREPDRTITFAAPLGGTIIEKPAQDGMRFEAGETLFRIADLSHVWVIVQIAEQDLTLVREGQTVHLTLPSMPGEEIEGMVDFIYPELDMETRSGRVRLLVPNPAGRLKLGLFAHAEIDAPVSDEPVLAVPVAAVIDDGARQRVFVAKGDGLFEPRDIELGAKAGDFLAIRGGLVEGEDVVTNGTFLIDAESNLQGALAAFTAGSGAP